MLQVGPENYIGYLQQQIIQQIMKDSNQGKSKTIAGKYVILLNYQLGKGSFATTYRCKLKNDPAHLLACKIMNKKQTQNLINDLDYLIKRVKEEVNAWKELNHPNIVKFQGCEQTINNIYFFLELCPDGNLGQYIHKAHYTSNIEFKILFTKELAEAVAYLQSKNIVHRDIKPQNIYLKDNHVKLGDFGLARAINIDDKQHLQSFFTFAGTLHYMAPQIIRRQKNPYKCDVWSVGVTIFNMFTSQLPFGMTYKDLSQKVVLDKIQLNKQEYKHPIFEKNQKIVRILEKMLNPNPAERPKMNQILSQIKQL